MQHQLTRDDQPRKLELCQSTVVTEYPKKYAHGFCFAVLCCGYTVTDFPISIRLTSLALWQSNDCPSASIATLMNMDKYFMWIHYERLHNHNKAKHNKTVCIFLGIYCIHSRIRLVLYVDTNMVSMSPLTAIYSYIIHQNNSLPQTYVMQFGKRDNKHFMYNLIM